jgi:RNA polymerase sigma factor for flagellar operon FliA
MKFIDPTRLVEDYADFVSYIAREIHKELYQRGGSGGDLEETELVQEGWLGLLEALRRFDPERGIKFSTFAAYRISGAILDYLRRAPLIRLPRARQQQLAEVDRARRQMERLGQEVTLERLAEGLVGREARPEQLAKALQELQALENFRYEVLSLEDSAPEKRDLIISMQPTPEQETLMKERQERKLKILEDFEACVKRLPFELLTIFILRDLGKLTLQEVAAVMNLRIDAVRRRQIRARKAVRDCLNMAGWPVEDIDELVDEDGNEELGAGEV